jgi:hypothetical protein
VGAVGRRVIQDYEMKILESLVQNAANALVNEEPRIMHGHYHADYWFTHS